MPHVTMKPCAKPFCPEIVPRSQHYCRAHGGNSNWGSVQAERGKAQRSRTSSTRWRHFRASIMRRDQFLCQPCKRSNRVSHASEVDHVVPIARGGVEFDPKNCQSICVPCHRKKTASEALAARQH